MPEFFERYGTEEKCVAALRWPQGFCCPRCDSPEHYTVGHGSRGLYQCRGCRHQASLTAGTALDNTKLPLRTWFLAMFLISQHKTGLPSLALIRHLGTSDRTAWIIHHKLMAAMAEHDSHEPLLDDAYLGGERPGVGGRGSPNKAPIVAAVQTNDLGRPLRLKVSPVAARTPRELPQLTWVNTILGNLKTMIHRARKAFKFGKYARQYLGAFAYHFNSRFDLAELMRNLFGHAAHAAPTREWQIRGLAEGHD